jgi:hypothetical protein
MTMPVKTGKKTKRPEPPPVTRAVLAGLTSAYIRMETDDLSDLGDDEQREFLEAGTWITRTWVHLNSKGK